MDVDTNRAELEAWLILLRTPGIGAATLHDLLGRHRHAQAALAAARRGDLGRADNDAARAWLRAPDRPRIDADIAWLAMAAHALLTFTDADFPPLLREIPAPPAALFVAGDASALWRPQVAIVGSRHASQGGSANAQAFAHALVAAGFAITSGLAEGIDGAAHAAALDAGGCTIAVLGTGVDIIYPLRHQDLAARIRDHGALVSEFPPGTAAHPTHFPRRNRIIAGLGVATLVVEASPRSGSLITARNSAESGREVFAIPGSIHNPLARGCHQLIRQGARLVESADEIIAELAPLTQGVCAQLRDRLSAAEASAGVADAARTLDPDYASLFAALGHDALGVDQLAQRTALPVATLSSMLLMLELEGQVVAAGGGAYARRV
ncbi:MAG: DNA-processing protein DprA [Dokdonella sp.]